MTVIMMFFVAKNHQNTSQPCIFFYVLKKSRACKHIFLGELSESDKNKIYQDHLLFTLSPFLAFISPLAKIFFDKNREEDSNDNIVINCYKFITIYNNL